MNGLRTAISAAAILVGSALIVMWLMAFVVVRAVEDGSAARTAAHVALRSPALMDRMSGEIYSRVSSSLDDLGFDVEALGVDGAVRTAADRVAHSEQLEQVVFDNVDAASDHLHSELTNPHRAPGPFSVEVDVNDALDAELRTVPLVGDTLASVRVPPVAVELLSAERFETARDSYERLEFAKRMFLWMGLACLVVGFAVSTRKRYVVGKFLVATGAFALVCGLMLAVLTPERLVELASGDATSTEGSIISAALSDEQLPHLRTLLLLVGSGTVVLGAAAVAWARRTTPRH